ncbi:MAG: hypothetical protein ABI876_12535 [Bacteroidota bacterium]
MKTMKNLKMIFSMMCGCAACVAVAGLGLYLITDRDGAGEATPIVPGRTR